VLLQLFVVWLIKPSGQRPLGISVQKEFGDFNPRLTEAAVPDANQHEIRPPFTQPATANLLLATVTK
jgi:hypothetical protein